jgi:hypothetical protein
MATAWRRWLSVTAGAAGAFATTTALAEPVIVREGESVEEFLLSITLSRVLFIYNVNRGLWLLCCVSM